MTGHSFNFRSSPHEGRSAVVKRATCTVTQFYKEPTSSDVVDLNNAFTIKWDPSCDSGFGRAVEIKLSSPSLPVNSSLVGHWKTVDFSKGSLQVAVAPTQFANKTDILLQLSITPEQENGQNVIPFLEEDTMGSSPTFKGKYDGAKPAATTVAANSFLGGNSSNNVVVVNNFYKGLTKGQVAAAVLMPILFVAACIAGYVFWSRKKEATRRKEYRENLDQRMSIAPGADWAPISAAGAAAAIRHSMAFSSGGDRNTRTSSFFGRQSGYQVDPPQEMRQTRTRTTSSDQPRTSRVSFAENTFDRSYDRPAVPPLPAAYRKSTFGDDEKDHDTLSPTQRQGAFSLDEDAIKDRLSAGNDDQAGRGGSVAFGQDMDTLPALAMMRANETSPAAPAPAMTRESTVGDYRTYSIGAYSGNTDSMVIDGNGPSYFNPPSGNADPDQALREYATRTPQMLPVTTTASPFSGFAAGPGLAAAAGFDLSPDAAFRAYAATRPAIPPTTTGSSTTMRTLYGPTMTQGLGLRERSETLTSNNPYRDSMAPGEDVGKAH
ncbi:hypothetical protein FRC18_010460 [Serendipita sp. 400]|nr:hypothetical protein FRC18_010460 [Serendipita sp. 400]